MWALTVLSPALARAKPFALAILAGGLSACSLSGVGQDSSLHVDLSGLRGESRFALLNSGGAIYGLGAPPQASSSFACYAVNVTGPGIADSSPTPHPGPELGPLFDRLMSRSSYCSYRGVVSPTITLGNSTASDVALQVPPGGVRLVQLVGVNDPLVCAAGVIADPPNSTSGGRYFEIGRAVLNDVFGDRSVDVASEWPTTAAERAARQMDCGDGGCSVTSEVAQSGTATAFAMNAPTMKVAFQLTTVPGKKIRRLTFLQAAQGSAGTVTSAVTLAKKAVGDSMANLVYYSGVSATASFTPTSTPQYAPVEYDLIDQSVNDYVMMASGTEYWVVVSATGISSTPTLNFIHNGGTGTGFQTYSGSWSPYGSSLGVVHSLVGCSL